MDGAWTQLFDNALLLGKACSLLSSLLFSLGLLLGKVCLLPYQAGLTSYLAISIPLSFLKTPYPDLPSGLILLLHFLQP